MSENILVAAIIAFTLMAVLWFVRGVLLTPVKPGKNQRLTVLIRLNGEAPELANTVNSLRWLIENGTIQADIELSACFSDEETERQAEILAEKGLIKIVDRG